MSNAATFSTHRALGRFWALIPCAGHGARAARDGEARIPKQYQMVAGRPLVLHTLEAFTAVRRLAGVLVAVASGDTFLQTHGALALDVEECGGPTRAATVIAGLHALGRRGADAEDWVLVHDAARCLITAGQIDALIDACAPDAVGGLLAHKLSDTLKAASPEQGRNRSVQTVDRGDKWLAQTPQMFRIGMLLAALEHAGNNVTDEASAIEATGRHPLLLEGGGQNFKVTYPEDFTLAEALLASRHRQ